MIYGDKKFEAFYLKSWLLDGGMIRTILRLWWLYNFIICSANETINVWFFCSIDCCRIVGNMIPRLGRTPIDQFTLKGAKRVQADHAGTWWGGVGWNPLRGLLSRGDVGQDVQVQEYSFLQNLGLYVIFHIYSIFKIYYTLKNILLLGSICFFPMF